MSFAFVQSLSIISALGISEEEHHSALLSQKSSVKQYTELLPIPYFSGKISQEDESTITQNITLTNLTRLEYFIHYSINEAVEKAGWSLEDPDLQVILSTTKGAIDYILNQDESTAQKAFLNNLQESLFQKLKLKNDIITISNACISGVLALNFGVNWLNKNQSGKVVVVGADELSQFTLSGFYCLNAMDDAICSPYDTDRKGINLGESVTTICISNQSNSSNIKIHSGASSNDANHISGPSRTGEGLKIAVEKTLEKNGISGDQIDFINGHGTATIFNDEMESIAFERCQLNNIPINSFKGYYGHTLGAAGVLEVASSILAIQHNVIYPSYGFKNLGTTKYLNVVQKPIEKDLHFCLKTASGFGGCNAALIIEKD